MTWQIAIDLDLCQGHGVCESEAPELFEVTRDRKVVALVAQPPDEQRRAAEQAVKYCPTRALKIIDQEVTP